jgi:hypothetical protein
LANFAGLEGEEWVSLMFPGGQVEEQEEKL